MEKLLDSKVQGALRHLLSTLGPVLALFLAVDDPVELLRKILESGNWIGLVGLIMSLLAFVASWKAAEKQNPKETDK